MGLRQVRSDPSAPSEAAEPKPTDGGPQPSATLSEPAADVVSGGRDLPGASAWRSLRSRLTDREDSEHEQILIRVVIAAAAFVYLFLVALGAGEAADLAARCIPLAIAYLSGSAALLGHLLWQPAAHPARRYCGMMLDMTTLTLALILGEATGALFYPFYLWVTFGMGFRYGRRYMFVSAALSLVSFAAVIYLTEYWYAQPALAASLWGALLVLPAYASTLLTKLTDALARAEEASVAKSRFLATMSHELRTPLHAIIGMADMLRGTRLDDDQADMVRTVRSAGRTLLDMISDVLDVAKIEFGSAEGRTAPFDLHGLIATVRALVHHQAASKGVGLHVEIDPRVPYQLQGAARPLQQILVNLVANGVKFTERGSITVRVQAEKLVPEQAFLRFEVEDTGIGIPDDAQERIFERFAQVDESATRRYGGTGLGLSIARQLANMMGGTLTVRSVLGAGTCFTLRAAFASTADAERSLQGRVVLVGAREVAATYLRRMVAWGIEATMVPDLGQACTALQRTQRHHVVVVVNEDRDQALALGDALTERFAAEPFDLILIGGTDRWNAKGCLAVLPAAVAEDTLYNALHAALAVPEAPADDSLTGPWRAGASRRILVAEDNRTNQRVIERMLRSVGHEVTIVGDGEKALEALEDKTFDIVLMDLNMPVMGGLDAIKLHRFSGGDRRTPRFVALTADASDETRRQSAEAGIDAYVTKPIEVRELLSLIDRLTRSEAEDQGASAATEADLPGIEVAAPSAVVVPHPSVAAGTPVLDRTYVDRLRQLDDEDGFLEAVIGDFIADADELAMQLEAAAEQGDSVAFRDCAHAIRSSAAHIGATSVFEMCLTWRHVDTAEVTEHGRVYAERLKSELERLRAALLAMLNEQTTS